MKRQRLWKCGMLALIGTVWLIGASVVKVQAEEVTELVEDVTGEEGDKGQTEDGFIYEELDDGTLGITGYVGKGGDIEIPAQIDGKNVTYIEWGFKGNTTITGVIIPSSIEIIEEWAFYGCSNLKYVKLPSKINQIRYNTFMDCSSLTEIEIPETVTVIDGAAFSGCSSLAEIEIPETVEEIGNGAFARCSSLENIILPSGITEISNDVFNGCTGLKNVELSENVTKIGNYAFNNCRSLETLNLPKGIIYVGHWAFGDCISWKGGNVVLDNVEEIGNNAFENCRWLKSIEIDGDITELEYIFSGCSGLKSISVYGNISKLKPGIFSGCTSVETINISKNVTNIENCYVFSACTSLMDINVDIDNTVYASVDGVLYDKELTKLLICPEGKRSIVIPKSVISIANDAFWNVDNDCANLTDINVNADNTVYASVDGVLYDKELTKLLICPEGKRSIVIPKSVTIIDSDAFYHCGNITELKVESENRHFFIKDAVLYYKHNISLKRCPVNKKGIFEIPSEVTYIWGDAFYGCIELTDIILPEGLTNIGPHAFERCDNLEKIYILNPNQKIDYPNTVFIECNKLKDIYYVGTKRQWKALYDLNEDDDLNDPWVKMGVTIHYNYKSSATGNPSSSGTNSDNSTNTTNEVSTSDTKTTYTITFKSNGGTKLSQSKINVSTGAAIGTLPTVIRKNYTFKGWYTQKSGGKKVTEETVFTKNQTLYAQWSKVSKPGKIKSFSVKSTKSGRITVNYKKVKSVKGYEISYSTNKKFISKTTKKVTASSTTKEIKKLKKGKNYYVRVRAYKVDSAKKKIYGTYSGVKKIEVKK